MIKKGTTLPELMIVLLIVSIGLFVVSKMTADYMKSVVMAKELFILNSALQEKYQLLIAYRNKWLETNFGPEGPPSITDWFNPGNYCIFFNTSTKEIILQPLNINNCSYSFINGSEPGIKYKININNTSQGSSITLDGLYPKFQLESKLEGILTRWHPFFQ